MNFLENILGKNNSFWRYLVTIVVTLFALLIGTIPALIVVVAGCIKAGIDLSSLKEVIQDSSIVGISQNLFLLLELSAFAVGLFALILLVRLFHKRSFSETVNGTKRVRWNRVFSGFGVWFLLMLVSLMLS